MDKNLRFETEIQSIEKINPLFSRATLKAFYTGVNRNGSFISKEVAEDAIKSIYNTPIVGEYIEQNDNFGGHGGEIVITDDEIKFKTTTMPYGVIPESATIKWENVTEVDGRVNEYLVIEGAYLWTGRYEELNGLLNTSYGQSMEIEVQNGSFAIVDGVEAFKVDEFLFSAFCILGIAKDGEDRVEPCFESASITTYSLDKDSFKKEFNQMISELKFSLEKEGGNEMSKENVTPEVEATESTEEVAIERDYEKTEVEATNPTEGTEEDKTETTEDANESPDTPEDFTEASNEATDESTTEQPEDATELTEEAEDETDYKTEYSTLLETHETLKSDFTTLQSQLDELQSYKRQREESDLKSKFEGKLSDEEFTQVFTEMKDETVETVEEKLFALIGKKTYSIQKPTNTKENKIKLAVSKEDAKPSSPYEALFTTYLQK